MDPFQHNLVSIYKPHSSGCVTAVGIKLPFREGPNENSTGFTSSLLTCKLPNPSHYTDCSDYCILTTLMCVVLTNF